MTVPVTALQVHETPGLRLGEQFRFHDAPPPLLRAVLDGIDPLHASMRFNDQPPAAWLVEVAGRLDGLLSGTSTVFPTGIRVDAICVPGSRASELAAAVRDDWPEACDGETALDLSLAEAWDSWSATEAVWQGNGRELLAGRPEPVVGLWWD